MTTQDRIDAAFSILQAQIEVIRSIADRPGLVQLAAVLEREGRMVRDRLQGKRGQYPKSEE